MKAVVVFESLFGNTERLAREIADGLAAGGDEARPARVRDAGPDALRACDLLVVGAPTHAFSLSRPSTREDAVRQGADAADAAVGVREWLATLDAAFPSAGSRPAVAVFDSRVQRVRHLPGSAARRAARILGSRGFHVLDQPVSFYVLDVKGPLAPGEPERARNWGARLAERARASRSAAS